MSIPGWKLKILVNNWVGEGACIAEHGLSMAIEGGDLADDQFVLFDTGRSPQVLFNNAQAMNVDWSKLLLIALSHSHYDHSGALVGIGRYLCRNISVIVHADTFTPKANFKPTFRDISIPCSKEELQAANILLSADSNDRFLTPNLCLTGKIERVVAFEDLSHKNLFRMSLGEYVPDIVMDDRALVIREPGVGFHLICGCCHSGLLNTLNHAAAISGERRALTIMGGLHLGSYDDDAMKRVTDQLAQWEPRRIIPLHCTGLRGSAQLWSRFGDIVEFHGAGETIELT
ncbi:MAG: MBL fold metallo-hydrolase [Deltaproteobacteria bacterium]|nr:MBL fold metallo-hydrolase [Deltaproteobacteria bacterium]